MEKYEVGRTFYRFEDDSFYKWTGELRPEGGLPEKYQVVSVTPRGVWVVAKWYAFSENLTNKYKRFINLEKVKKFAHPTVEEALESFKRRKMRQLDILEVQTNRCKEILEALNAG